MHRHRLSDTAACLSLCSLTFEDWLPKGLSRGVDEFQAGRFSPEGITACTIWVCLAPLSTLCLLSEALSLSLAT
jgi:hypothetical protein